MLDTLPRAGGQLQAILDSGAVLAGAALQPPDAAQVADAVARDQASRALREFRARLYACLTARPDALFELVDAILCADHAVTSLVQLSLVPAFRRGHGALYGALADGRIKEEKLAALLTATLPQLVDGDEGRAWVAEHDTIDYGLLERALAGLPAEAAGAGAGGVRPLAAAAVRDRCHAVSPAGRRVLAGARARAPRRVPVRRDPQDRPGVGVPVCRGARAPAHRLGRAGRCGAHHPR